MSKKKNARVNRFADTGLARPGHLLRSPLFPFKHSFRFSSAIGDQEVVPFPSIPDPAFQELSRYFADFVQLWRFQLFQYLLVRYFNSYQ